MSTTTELLLRSCFVGNDADLARYRAVVLRVPAARLSRVAAWLLMPWRLRAAERRLVRQGLTVAGRFACYPDADSPTFVYHVGSAASRYAEANLLAPSGGGRLDRLLRRFLSSWSGCDCSVGAIIVVGRFAGWRRRSEDGTLWEGDELFNARSDLETQNAKGPGR